MTFVIVTSSAREREHLHQEPNSSKPNQTEWLDIINKND